MKLITQELRARLVQNGRVRRRLDEEGLADPDFIPVVKLFTPDGPCTWLITELDPDDPEIAFGLADCGMGFPEMGTVFVPELESARGPLGMAIERDLHFAPVFTIGVYARAAIEPRRIVEDDESLEHAAVLRRAELAREGGAS